MTLIRFDEVYVVYFKTSKKAIREYPNMLNYLRELYQVPELRETTFMSHIKFHYFTSHSALNYYRYLGLFHRNNFSNLRHSIVPTTSNTLQLLLLPHDRHRFEST